MGVPESKAKPDASKYGNIYYQTDKPSYTCGETITGKIYINLISPFPGNNLFLKFEGKETVHIVENVRQHQDNQEVLYSDSKIITSQNLLVYSWEYLQSGQFVIPFSFLLPGNLPNSFYQQGHRYLAFVEYTLEAYLKPNDPKSPKLSYRQNLTVRQPLKKAQENHSMEVVTKLKTCCCLPKGSNLLKATFDKNIYAPGEIVQIEMQLDNSQSRLENSGVVFALKQTLSLRAGHKTKIENFEKVQDKLGGIPKDSFIKTKTLEFKLPSNLSYANDEINKRSPNKHDLLKLQENNNVLTTSTKSSLISSEYSLAVYCKMKGCCSTTPTITYPINFYYPEKEAPKVTPPTDWNPQIIPNVNIVCQSSQYCPVTIPVEENTPMIHSEMIQYKSDGNVELEMPIIVKHNSEGKGELDTNNNSTEEGSQ